MELKVTYDEYSKKCRINPEIIELVRENFSVENIQGRITKKYGYNLPKRNYAISPNGICDPCLVYEIAKYIKSLDLPCRVTIDDISLSKIKPKIPNVTICQVPNSKYSLRDYQENSIHQVILNGRGIIKVGTGGGKCLHGDQGVLLYDGNIKNARNIIIGDTLMGDDNTPRLVTSVCSGYEQMYKIKLKDNTDFICNESHILSLKWNGKNTKKYKKGNIYDISINDYFTLSKKEKHCLKAFKVGVDFNEQYCSIDPYLMGLWLAEGTKLNGRPEFSINCNDLEIIEYLKTYLHSIKPTEKNYYKISIYDKKKYNMKSKFIREFKRCIIEDNNIIIPKNYIINSKTIRLKILAGLLDGDGHLHNNCYEIITKWKTLCNDICFLVRSLGLRAVVGEKKVNNVIYYRIGISGNTNIIPIKLQRKKASSRLINKNALHCGFSIEKLGIGKYYGFEISGNNHRFLLSNFIVTHNTLVIASLLCSIFKTNPKFKTIIIVPNLGLVEQTYNDFEDYGCPFSFSKWTGKVEPNFDSNVIITNSACIRSNAEKKILKVEQVLYNFCVKTHAGKNYKEIFEILKTKNTSILKGVVLRGKRYKTFEEFLEKNDYQYLKRFCDRILDIVYIKTRLNELYNDTNFVIIDECHDVNETSKLGDILDYFKTSNKIGFTGTLSKKPMDRWLCLGKIGPVIYSKNSKSLRDEDYISNAEIQILKFNYKKSPRYKRKVEGEFYSPTENYNIEKQFIYNSVFRKSIIRGLCKKYSQNVLILVENIEYAEILHDYLSQIEGKSVYYIHGGVDVDEREKIKQIMESEDNVICIAISKIFTVGISIKNLPVIITVNFGKSFIKIIQGIGRGLRKHENKEKLILFDLSDNLRYSNQHLIDRMKFYSEESFNFKLKEINEL